MNYRTFEDVSIAEIGLGTWHRKLREFYDDEIRSEIRGHY